MCGNFSFMNEIFNIVVAICLAACACTYIIMYFKKKIVESNNNSKKELLDINTKHQKDMKDLEYRHKKEIEELKLR